MKGSDKMKQIVVEVWGDLALFTRPESKVERLTYPVPTPSAARGLLAAIYSKPKEFYWQINQIEVLNQIQYISFRRNEVKDRVSNKPILVEDSRTQRNGTYLKNVRYRIRATIIKQPSFQGSYEQLYEQAIRRIQNGKCFYQPYLGKRECTAYFEISDEIRKPINEDMELGIMLYDVFNLHDYTVSPKPDVSLFAAKMVGGVIQIPDYDDPKVLKGVTIDA